MELDESCEMKAALERTAESLKSEVAELRSQEASANAMLETNEKLRTENAELMKWKSQADTQDMRLKAALSEIEMLKQQESKQADELRSLTAQNQRYEQLLDETQAALKNQRAVVESLKEAVDRQGNAGGSGICNIQTEQSLAEVDLMVKELAAASLTLREAAETSKQTSTPVAHHSEEFMAEMKAAIKEQLAAEMTSLREVMTPVATPIHESPLHPTPMIAEEACLTPHRYPVASWKNKLAAAASSPVTPQQENILPKTDEVVGGGMDVSAAVDVEKVVKGYLDEALEEVSDDEEHVEPLVLLEPIKKVSSMRERELLQLEREFHETAEMLVKQVAWIANYLGRLNKHVSGEGIVKPPKTEDGSETDFMRILVKLLSKTQHAELRARKCLQEMFGQLEPEPSENVTLANVNFWTKQCKVPPVLRALQTNMSLIKKECEVKIVHVVQEKEEALVKCSREWKRAIRTAAKRMNKESAGPCGSSSIKIDVAKANNMNTVAAE